jgi:hypothetical protein
VKIALLWSLSKIEVFLIEEQFRWRPADHPRLRLLLETRQGSLSEQWINLMSFYLEGNASS